MRTIFSVVLVILAIQVNAQAPTLAAATAEADKGNYKKAAAMMSELIEASKESPRAQYYIHYSNFQAQSGDPEAGFKTLMIAIELMPDSVDLYGMRGSVLDLFDLSEEAIIDFTEGYLRATTDNARSKFLTSRGGVKYKIRDFNGAYTDLTKAISLDSTNLDALNNIAIVTDEMGKPEEGFEYLKQIIRVKPDYIPAYVNIGFKLQKTEQHTEAIEYFGKAIVLDPMEPYAYSNRSFSKLKMKDLTGALEDINYSLKLMPTNSYALKIRALIQLESKKQKLACKDLYEARDLGYRKQYGTEVDDLIETHCKQYPPKQK